MSLNNEVLERTLVRRITYPASFGIHAAGTPVGRAEQTFLGTQQTSTGRLQTHNRYSIQLPEFLLIRTDFNNLKKP